MIAGTPYYGSEDGSYNNAAQEKLHPTLVTLAYAQGIYTHVKPSATGSEFTYYVVWPWGIISCQNPYTAIQFYSRYLTLMTPELQYAMKNLSNAFGEFDLDNVGYRLFSRIITATNDVNASFHKLHVDTSPGLVVALLNAYTAKIAQQYALLSVEYPVKIPSQLTEVFDTTHS